MTNIVHKKDCFAVRADEGEEIVQTLHLFNHPAILWEYTKDHQSVAFEYFQWRIEFAIKEAGYKLPTVKSRFFINLFMGLCDDPWTDRIQMFKDSVVFLNDEIPSSWGKGPREYREELQPVNYMANVAEELIGRISLDADHKLPEMCRFWNNHRPSLSEVFVNIEKCGRITNSYFEYRKLVLFLLAQYQSWYNSLSIEIQEDIRHQIGMAYL